MPITVPLAFTVSGTTQSVLEIYLHIVLDFKTHFFQLILVEELSRNIFSKQKKKQKIVQNHYEQFFVSFLAY